MKNKIFKTHYLIFTLFITVFLSCERELEDKEESTKIEVLWRSEINKGQSFQSFDSGLNIYGDEIIITGYFNNSNNNIETHQVKSFDTNTQKETWNYTYNDLTSYSLKSRIIGETFFDFKFRSNNTIDLADKMLKSVSIENDYRIMDDPTLYDNRFYRSCKSKFEKDTYTIVSQDIFTDDIKEHITINCEKLSSPGFWKDPNTDELVIIVVVHHPIGAGNISSAYAYDQNNELIFKIDHVPSAFLHTSLLHKSPLIYDNTLVISGNKKISAYDLISKEILWEYETNDIVDDIQEVQPVVIDDKLIFNFRDRDITCLNIKNGELLWNNENQCRHCSDQLLYNEERNLLIFTDDYRRNLIVLNPDDGSTYYINDEHDIYGYDVVYHKNKDTYYSRTKKEIIAFKIL